MSRDFLDSIRSIIDQQNVNTAEGRELMSLIGDAMETVTLDEEKFVELFNQILNSYNKGDNKNIIMKLIDSLGSLFGLHVISKGEQLELVHHTLQKSSDMLSFNQTKLAIVLNRFTTAINSMNERSEALKKVNAELENRLSAAVRDAENIKTQLYSLQASEDSDDNDILKHVQRMLAEKRDIYDTEDPGDDAFVQFTEYLEVSWSWDIEKYKTGFTTYKISDVSKEGIRLPCLLKDGKVVLKGLRYQYDPEENE